MQPPQQPPETHAAHAPTKHASSLAYRTVTGRGSVFGLLGTIALCLGVLAATLAPLEPDAPGSVLNYTLNPKPGRSHKAS